MCGCGCCHCLCGRGQWDGHLAWTLSWSESISLNKHDMINRVRWKMKIVEIKYNSGSIGSHIFSWFQNGITHWYWSFLDFVNQVWRWTNSSTVMLVTWPVVLCRGMDSEWGHLSLLHILATPRNIKYGIVVAQWPQLWNQFTMSGSNTS